jgi:hypothetical protein
MRVATGAMTHNSPMNIHLVVMITMQIRVTEPIMITIEETAELRLIVQDHRTLKMMIGGIMMTGGEATDLHPIVRTLRLLQGTITAIHVDMMMIVVTTMIDSMTESAGIVMIPTAAAAVATVEACASISLIGDVATVRLADFLMGMTATIERNQQDQTNVGVMAAISTMASERMERFVLPRDFVVPMMAICNPVQRMHLLLHNHLQVLVEVWGEVPT